MAFPPAPENNGRTNDDVTGRSSETDGGRQLWEKQLKEGDIMERAQKRVQWMLRRVVGSSSADHLLGAYVNDDDTTTVAVPLTIQDVQRIASQLEKKGDSLSLLLESFSGLESSVDETDVDTCQYWKDRIDESKAKNNIDLSWKALLPFPLQDAACQVLKLYDKPTNNPANIQHYLQYHTSYTQRQVQHFILPHQRQQLMQLQKHHSKLQLLHKELELRYNTAFEEWDDYCMGVMGVESDSLPLFPSYTTNDSGEEEGGGGASETNAVVDQYANEVGKHVWESMKTEFQVLSERFVSLLIAAESSSDPPASMGKNGKEIARAIVHYRQFTKFVREATQQNLADDVCDDVLTTLCSFVDDSDVSLVYDFMVSPSIRVKLVSDLQQLETFLSSRKRELSRSSVSSSSSSYRSGGSSIVEAIDMKWTQFCLESKAEAMSLDEITRLHDRIHNVLMQIVGDSSQARRFRFLADTVGIADVNDSSSFTGYISYNFHLIGTKAAHLARRMAICHDQREAMQRVVNEHALKVNLLERKVMLL
jgi:hypothetical protein